MSRAEKSSLFGTDGIRGSVGSFPLDSVSLIKLGNSLGELLKGAKIVIGRDTRVSGREIAELIGRGISGRAEVYDCGVIPTPGLSFVTRGSGFDWGIMITASHNPYTDNGIKIFNGSGEKIDTGLEQEIEKKFFKILASGPAARGANERRSLSRQANRPSKVFGSPETFLQKGFWPPEAGLAAYKNFLIEQAGELKSRKLKIVLDCANGAVFEIAPAVIRETGFEVEVIGASPDGRNINEQCGSTYPENLEEKVNACGADLGIAFDGDGDRVIFADKEGHILDGDHTLYAISRYLIETERDFNKVVVGTVMGNLGLEKALGELGLRYLRADVGDRNVYREMKRTGSIIGGEQSGHTILSFLQNTGDGILTALYFLKALFYFDLEAAELFDRLPLYPQETRSIKISERKDLDNWREFQEKKAEFENKYGKNSRLLVRYSGTEPKIRIMIESEQESVIRENLEIFTGLIQSEIGG